jgi:hypothetical protein
MATKARIQDDAVAEIITADPFPPFHESLVWIECPAGTVMGSTFDGNKFFAPTTPPIDNTYQIKTRLAQIGIETIRPLRAVYAGTATQVDHDKLTALEAEAIQLRGELNAH